MKTSKQQQFYDVYKKNLLTCVKKYPDQYAYNEEQVNIIADKMYEAFMKRSANKDGPAIKMTCKELKIGYTYKAIEEYLGIR